MKSKRPAAPGPALPPKRGRGRPPKSDLDKALDKAKAEFLAFALDKCAKMLAAEFAKTGVEVSSKKAHAMMLRIFAAGQFKSVDTIRDVLNPVRRVSRTKRG